MGINIYLLIRKLERTKRYKAIESLHCYKDSSYEEGYACFQDRLKSRYPDSDLHGKHLVVYRWDSLTYDIFHQEQMRVLDSMAANDGRPQIEYIFVTEMEEEPSLAFLKRNGDDFRSIKMLYGMDDFISGVHHLKGVGIVRTAIIDHRPEKEPTGNDQGPAHNNLKQSTLYLMMEADGKVSYTNGNKYRILKDSTFLRKLSALTSDKQMILN